jgi:hypothetical protein
MSASEATAEVFWTAFRALPKKDQTAVVSRFLRDRQLREDIIDIATIEQRRREPGRSLDSYLADRRTKRRQ